jgi:lipopolysaccharide/colanic/teichoic acid biosynthesis glycosyltransferase
MEVAFAPRSTALRPAPPPAGPAYERPVRRQERAKEVTLHLVRSSDVLPVRDFDIPELPAHSERAIRIANVVVASIALVAVAPIMGCIAALIRFTSKGPALYSQTRVGVDRRWRQKHGDDRRVHDHGGKPFQMYKFRSMRLDAEPDGRAVWAQKQDPRVTTIGRVLRKTRLDELPQLYNVLRGDMNIVGPRPERPSIFAELRENIPDYSIRQRVPPGITGWAQVNQAYDSCIDDVRRKVEYDLEYLQRRSLGLDLRIMSMTIPVMLLRRGGQ